MTNDRTAELLRVSRIIETLVAEISCAPDRNEVCDLARRGAEVVSVLHETPDRDRLNERLADAVAERLQHFNFTADDIRAGSGEL